MNMHCSHSCFYPFIPRIFFITVQFLVSFSTWNLRCYLRSCFSELGSNTAQRLIFQQNRIIVSLTILKGKEILRIMHELPWITIFGSRVRRFANNFHDWRSHENHWQIASRVTQKSLFMVTNVLFCFLHAIWCPEHSIPPKQLLIADFTVVAKDSLFWFSTVTSPQLICDVRRV